MSSMKESYLLFPKKMLSIVSSKNNTQEVTLLQRNYTFFASFVVRMGCYLLLSSSPQVGHLFQLPEDHAN